MSEITWECQFEGFGNEYSIAARFNSEFGLIRHHNIIPCLKASKEPPKDVIAATKVVIAWELEVILRDKANKKAKDIFATKLISAQLNGELKTITGVIDRERN